MAYGKIYTSSFDTINTLISIQVDIFKKDYTGDTYTILLSGDPVRQEWQEDDPKAPIKGCNLDLSIIANHNLAGYTNVSLANFYSSEDDTFLIEVRRIQNDEILFTGFLIQDDCAEIQIDGAHEIKLSFTDNLGLLKDLTVYQAAYEFGVPTTVNFTISSDSYTLPGYILIYSDTLSLNPGDQFTIDSGALAGTYTFLSIEYNSTASSNIVLVLEPIPPGTITSYPSDIFYNQRLDLNTFYSLAQVLRLCLRSTYLSLPTKVMSQLVPIGGSTGRWLDDTFIDGKTLKNGDSYMNCYEALELIMSRFNATLFQAHGSWWIVRWGELFNYINYSGANLGGFNYDENMIYTSGTYSQDNYLIGTGNDIVSGWVKSIKRPYKQVVESFNYSLLSNLLENGNLTTLGNFRTSYPIRGGRRTVFEYDLPGWYDYDLSTGPYPTRFIRITYEDEKEIERILVVIGSVYNYAFALQSNNILINKYDKINLSFDVKTAGSNAGPVQYIFHFRLTDGTNTYYFSSTSGDWVQSPSPISYTLPIASGDNTNQWHTLNVDTDLAPIDGIFNIFLMEFDPTDETHYDNFSIDVIANTAGSRKIIGNRHTTSQPITTKNVDDKTIRLDDAIYTTSGCLFLDTTTGILRDKTKTWNLSFLSTQYEKKLGWWTTFEDSFQNSRPITKFNGTILNIFDETMTNIVSPLSVFKYFADALLLGKRFTTGSVAIDYKNTSADISIYEMADEDFTIDQYIGESLYYFEYIYEAN